MYLRRMRENNDATASEDRRVSGAASCERQGRPVKGNELLCEIAFPRGGAPRRPLEKFGRIVQ